MSDTIDDGTVDQGLGSGSTDMLPEEGVLPELLLGEGSRVVSARGTEEGLVLRIDGRAEWQQILDELEDFLGKRRRFLEGGQVSLEWLERLPTKEQSKELEDVLKDRYEIQVVPRRRKSPQIRLAKDDKVSKQQKKGGGITISLFEEAGASGSGSSLTLDAPGKDFAGRSEGLPAAYHEALYGLDSGTGPSKAGSYISPTSRRYLSQMSKMLGDEAYYEEDANAKIVFGTLRSGQRFETPFSLIVVGDVNPGADLIAGGDIIVLGNLRGTAHASAYDDDSFDHVIIALRMQPMQLRIGSVISRGSDEEVKGAEIARIENRRIIVEPFSTREFLSRRLK